MSDENALEAQRKRSARIHLILIGAIAAFPFVGSYVLYKFWRPTSFMNHGELVAQQQPRMPAPTDPAGIAMNALKGKWVLATVDAAACDKACTDKLYFVRQIRLTQGKEMERIERVWLVSDAATPDPALLKEHKGLHVVAAQNSAWTRELPAKDKINDYIYIIDPLGNVVLRYPPGFNPTGMKKDLARLIRASRIG